MQEYVSFEKETSEPHISRTAELQAKGRLNTKFLLSENISKLLLQRICGTCDTVSWEWREGVKPKCEYSCKIQYPEYSTAPSKQYRIDVRGENTYGVPAVIEVHLILTSSILCGHVCVSTAVSLLAFLIPSSAHAMSSRLDDSVARMVADRTPTCYYKSKCEVWMRAKHFVNAKKEKDLSKRMLSLVDDRDQTTLGKLMQDNGAPEVRYGCLRNKSSIWVTPRGAAALLKGCYPRRRLRTKTSMTKPVTLPLEKFLSWKSDLNIRDEQELSVVKSFFFGQVLKLKLGTLQQIDGWRTSFPARLRDQAKLAISQARDEDAIISSVMTAAKVWSGVWSVYEDDLKAELRRLKSAIDAPLVWRAVLNTREIYRVRIHDALKEVIAAYRCSGAGEILVADLARRAAAKLNIVIPL